MESYNILIVDDEPGTRRSLEMMVLLHGLGEPEGCEDPNRVPGLLATGRFNLVLLDVIMPAMSGEELLARLTRDYPHIPVVMVTGANDADTALRCIRNGAYDYLVKPVDTTRFVAVIRHLRESHQLREENALLVDSFRSSSEGRSPDSVFDPYDTAYPPLRALFCYVEAIARTPQPVLITGETGVGKEGIAVALHRLSGRSGPLVSLNVAGLDETMFSDTLFGHVSGAYTGATAHRSGLIKEAERGTLFLDEIGDLQIPAQVKLLRLLQEGEYRQLGANTVFKSTARVVVSTQADLAKKLDDGTFRRDLYYRLCHHRVHVPPLRDRLRTDLPRLAARLVARAAERLGRPAPAIAPALLERCVRHDFPGNVRELEGLLFDAVARCTGPELGPELLPASLSRELPQPSAPATREEAGHVFFGATLPTLKGVQDLLIQEALRRTDGNHTAAARLLGVTQQAISRRVRGTTDSDTP